MSQTAASTSPAALNSPAGAAVVPLPVAALSRFQRLMAYEGWDVDTARMCLDTGYAHACLATAHTSSHQALREAALLLFNAFGRNAAPAPLH